MSLYFFDINKVNPVHHIFLNTNSLTNTKYI